MAESLGNFLDRIQVGDDETNQIAIGSSAFAVCSTAATTATKVADIPGFELREGTTVHIKFTYENTAADAALKIGSSTAKTIVDDDSTTTGAVVRWSAGATLTFTYDGINWIKNSGGGGSGSVNSWEDLTDTPTTIDGYGITDAYIDDGEIIIGNDTILPITEVNGYTGSSITIAASDLGLENALHFVGVATVAITDGGSEDPEIGGETYAERGVTAQDGDLVIDQNSMREYVWSDGAWVLLGFTADVNYVSSAESPTISNTPTWITGLTQYTDGTVRVSRETIGILPVSHGGTGQESFTADRVILSNASTTTGAFTERAYIHRDAATALGTTNNFVTEKTVYHGLPTINNSHAYSSADTLFAPVTSGSIYQLLVSNGTDHAPVWASAALVISETSDTADTAAYTILTLGNSANITSITAHSEGQIQLYSASTEAHIIQGRSTSTEYTHTLQNASGYILQGLTTSVIGSNTQPVYFAEHGIATPLTYTPNRLYYSDDAVSGETYATDFIAGNYFANGTALGINITAWPESNTDKLYVSGSATMTGALNIGSTFSALGNVGIGCEPGEVPDLNASHINHILVINGSTLITQNNSEIAHFDILTNSFSFHPETTGSGTIGLSTNKWKELYLKNLVSIVDTDSSIILNVNDTAGSVDTSVTLTSANPQINLSSISNNTQVDWNIWNELGILSIKRSNLILIQGGEYGFTLAPRLYINSTLSSSTVLDFYVNGWSELYGSVGIGDEPGLYDVAAVGLTPAINYILTVTGKTYHTDDITFKPNTPTSLISPKINWSGDSTASIFYRSDSNHEYLVAQADNVVFNDGTYDKAFLDVGNAYFYPPTIDNEGKGGSLGLGGTNYTNGAQGTARRWSSVFIGSADTYGDSYLPIYWLNGVPTPTAGVVQYAPFTFTQGTASVTIMSAAYNQLYGFHTYVLQIVVTSGESNLNAPINWESTQTQIEGIGAITLSTTTAVSGPVSGYILTARGTAAPIYNTPPPVTPPETPPSSEEPSSGEEP